MPTYIVCHQKRNNPRVDVRICERRCAAKQECKEFNAHLSTSNPEEIAPTSVGSDPAELEAA